MTRFVALHSFTRKAGTSTLAANLAVLLARSGLAVALVECDRTHDTTESSLGIASDGVRFVDLCRKGTQAGSPAQDVSGALGVEEGRLLVIPGGRRRAAEGDDGAVTTDQLTTLLGALVATARPEVVILDAETGLLPETMAIFAIADDLLEVVVPDPAGHQGSAVTIDVAARLGVPQRWIVLNHAAAVPLPADQRMELQSAFAIPLLAEIPDAPELPAAGAAPFVLTRTTHPWSESTYEMARALVRAEIVVRGAVTQ